MNSRAYEDPQCGSIFLKHLLEYLPRKEDVGSVIGAVQESLGHDPLAREIQFPEFRSALREKRSLLDGDRYPVNPGPAYANWRDVSKFGASGLRDQSFVHEFSQVDAKVGVNFHHEHSNVVRMEARIIRSATPQRLWANIDGATDLGIS